MRWLIEMAPVAVFAAAYFFYPDLPALWLEAIRGLLPLAPGAGILSERIYAATAALMAALVVQCLLLRALGQLNRTHIAALALVWLFGGMTLLLQNPVFIKWKPTILYWGMALAFAGSFWVGRRTLVERMLTRLGVGMAAEHWRSLNLIWVGFFAVCGLLNLYVAYSFSEEFWVQFKFFGLAVAAPLLFLAVQAVYLAPRATSAEDDPGAAPRP